MFRVTLRANSHPQSPAAAIAANVFSGNRPGLPLHHLPPSSNLSTLTALGIGLQPQQSQLGSNILSSASAAASRTSSSASSASPSTSSFSATSTSAAAVGSSAFFSAAGFDTSAGTPGSANYSFFPPTAKNSIDPLSWRLPSPVQLQQQQQRSGFGGGDKGLSLIKPSDALAAIQSPAHVIAPLPLDAAVVCLGVAMESYLTQKKNTNNNSNADASGFIKEMSTAIWNYPSTSNGAGAILSRLVDILQSRPKTLFPKFGQAGHSARDICDLLVEIVKTGSGGDSVGNNASSAASIVFSQHPEYFKAATKIMKLHRQVTILSSSSSSKNNNNAVVSSDVDFSWFLEAAVTTIGIASSSSSQLHQQNSNNKLNSELPAFADICDLCSSQLLLLQQQQQQRTNSSSSSNRAMELIQPYASSLLNSFNKVHHNVVKQGAPFYLDVCEGVANLMMLLTMTADSNKNDFAETVVSLWLNIAQHSRAGESTVSYSSSRIPFYNNNNNHNNNQTNTTSQNKNSSSSSSSSSRGRSYFYNDITHSSVTTNAATISRSALVGALAMTNRSTEAFDQEEVMFEAGLILDPQVQLILIRSVLVGGNTSSTSNEESSQASSFATNSFILRKELDILYKLAKDHWSFLKRGNNNHMMRNLNNSNNKNAETDSKFYQGNSLEELSVDVRLGLLQICWETGMKGKYLLSIARTFFPADFVSRKMTTSEEGSTTSTTSSKIDIASIASSSLFSNQHEILCALLRSLILVQDFEYFKQHNTTTTSAPEGEQEASSSASSNIPHMISQLPKNYLLKIQTNEEYEKYIKDTVVEELNFLSTVALDEVVGSALNKEQDAELWGCVVGAAAACGCRSVLLDTAMALKSVQPDEKFTEIVMLTAIECLRNRDWTFSKLVVAELSRALSVNASPDQQKQNVLSEKVMSTLLSLQQVQQAKQGKKKSTSTNSEEGTVGTAVVHEKKMEEIVKEFFN